jgi:hypothetical protein
MKLIIHVKGRKSGREWDEDFDSENVTHTADFGKRQQRKIAITSQTEAERWAKALINWFNLTCGPGESGRDLLGVKLCQ